MLRICNDQCTVQAGLVPRHSVIGEKSNYRAPGNEATCRQAVTRIDLRSDEMDSLQLIYHHPTPPTSVSPRSSMACSSSSGMLSSVACFSCRCLHSAVSWAMWACFGSDAPAPDTLAPIAPVPGAADELAAAALPLSLSLLLGDRERDDELPERERELPLE